jgi:hypothetical protein
LFLSEEEHVEEGNDMVWELSKDICSLAFIRLLNPIQNAETSYPKDFKD